MVVEAPGAHPRLVRVGVALVLGTSACSVSALRRPPEPPVPARSAGEQSPNAPAKAPDGPGRDPGTPAFPTAPALQPQGMTLYQNGCASCHGTLLQGIRGGARRSPDVGAGPVDFYLSTGRMPLQAPDDEPERATGIRPSPDRRADRVHHPDGWRPAAPAADPAAGDLATGFQVFTENCAGCHQIVGRGGMTVGAYVPNLQTRRRSRSPKRCGWVRT